MLNITQSKLSPFYITEFRQALRTDAKTKGKKPQCQKPTSYNCGQACINISKGCKNSPDDAIAKGRLNKLRDMAVSYVEAKDIDKVNATQKQIVEIEKLRGEKAKRLLEERAAGRSQVPVKILTDENTKDQSDIQKLEQDLDSVKKLIQTNINVFPGKINSSRNNSIKQNHQKLLIHEKEIEEKINTIKAKQTPVKLAPEDIPKVAGQTPVKVTVEDVTPVSTIKESQSKKTAKPKKGTNEYHQQELQKLVESDPITKDVTTLAYNYYLQNQSGMNSRALASNYQIPNATAVAKINAVKESVGLSRSSTPVINKELGERIDKVLKGEYPPEPTTITPAGQTPVSQAIETKQGVTTQKVGKQTKVSVPVETGGKVTVKAKTKKQQPVKLPDDLPSEPVQQTPPPRPKLKSNNHIQNEAYDNWLNSESQNLQGRDGKYKIKTGNGKKSVSGRTYGNLGIHEEKGSFTSKYYITHVKSGMGLGSFEDEEQAKKALVEAGRSGIDWSLDEDGLLALPSVQSKMKKVKRLMDIAVESDKRGKSRAEWEAEDKRRQERWEKEIQKRNEAQTPVKLPDDFPPAPSSGTTQKKLLT